MCKIITAIAICMILAGCQSMPLKKGGLYLNQQTSIGMDDLGVAKMRSQF